ncbi:MAG: YidC/Oxa1 family membrane protein insertase [Candidatus Saccharibacteria bacterium]|nr:YidC/Oxa1 family membrane protein insertase [Candidatus Saccharibacteria bacterium]
MFTTLIVQPIFNVLSAIYALIPGHDFGVAIILFTILARIALYPMLKKQLKNTKAMRELQPELKKIKEASKGNKQQESIMMMELYKEKEIKPLSQIGLMVLQIIVFLALFSGLNKVVNNPQEIVDFSYPVVQNTSWIKEVSTDISKFDFSFMGSVDLKRAAVESGKSLYIPALLLTIGSALIQFLQIKQTMPQDKNARKLKEILRDANTGKQADSSEINAAMTRNMMYFMPALIFVLTIGFPAALSLYWFVGGLIAYTQQKRLLEQDEYMITHASAVVVRKKSLKPEEETAKIKTTPKKSSKAKSNKRKK